MKRPKTDRKMSRDENASHTYNILVEAALRSVFRHGFGKSSVSRITEEAGVAQGSLYTYFGSHQALMELLLPLEGERILDALAESARGAQNYFEVERRTFIALAEYFERRPYMLRLLLEAEVAAPDSFARHMRNIEDRYVRAFRRALSAGDIRPFKPRELPVIAEVLSGCRAHIVQHQRARTEPGTPERRRVIELGATAYLKFLRGGLGEPHVPEIRKLKPASFPKPSPSDTKSILFEAAGEEIEKSGFAATTVKEIAARAGVAVGTFYAHFPGREEFFEELLIYARRQLTRYIKSMTQGATSFAELEVRGFQAFFEVVRTKTWLVRIAAEAAAWAPNSFHNRYLRPIARGYNAQLLAAQKAGEFRAYTRSELIVLGPIFMAARHYLASRYMRGSAAMMPNWIVKTYADFICRGLGRGEAPAGRDRSDEAEACEAVAG